MISPADVLCVAVAAGLIALQANRGMVPALVDFACILAGVIAIRFVYVPVAEYMRPSSAYLLLLGLVIVLTVLLSIYISRRLKIHVTAIEAAVGATLGLLSAMVLSYAFFEWLVIKYGAGAPIIRDSMLSWLVSDLAGFRAFADFLHTLMGR